MAKERGWRAMPSRIARDLTLAMALKIVLLAALFALFAHPAYKPANDPAATAASVVGTFQGEEANR